MPRGVRARAPCVRCQITRSASYVAIKSQDLRIAESASVFAARICSACRLYLRAANLNTGQGRELTAPTPRLLTGSSGITIPQPVPRNARSCLPVSRENADHIAPGRGQGGPRVPMAAITRRDAGYSGHIRSPLLPAPPSAPSVWTHPVAEVTNRDVVPQTNLCTPFRNRAGALLAADADDFTPRRRCINIRAAACALDHNRGRPGGQLREAGLITARRAADMCADSIF